MTLAETQCAGCAHYRELKRYAVPTCAKEPHPHGGDAQLACVVAFEACGGRNRETKR